MQSFTIVALTNLYDVKRSGINNFFVPYRPNHCRLHRKVDRDNNYRSQSAIITSELRPISQVACRQKYLTRKESANKANTRAVVSAKLKNEIQSAVLLMENRSENDIQAMCQADDKVMEESDVSMFQSQVPIRTNKLKSSSSSQLPSTNEVARHKIIKLVAMKPCDFNNEVISPVQTPHEVSKLPSSTDQCASFISSVSNCLTNVVTIDDLHGVTIPWTKKTQNIPINQESDMEAPTKRHNIERSQTATNHHRRVKVLRDYMSVYLDWRINQTIAEHRDLAFGRATQSRIRTAVPQSRLESFNKIIDDRQNPIQRRKNAEDKEQEYEEVQPEASVCGPAYNMRSTNPFLFPRIGSRRTLLKQGQSTAEMKPETPLEPEKTGPNESEEYSDIDWLEQCDW